MSPEDSLGCEALSTTQLYRLAKPQFGVGGARKATRTTVNLAQALKHALPFTHCHSVPLTSTIANSVGAHYPRKGLGVRASGLRFRG